MFTKNVSALEVSQDAPLVISDRLLGGPLQPPQDERRTHLGQHGPREWNNAIKLEQ